ncbi:septal ring lytic transglycosylase RlpA family protein [Marilutibacter spongiae]|uniref:Endolytic peptidoglycan transglycosylase RlpA n=1 Tax=Marilutibacter spongiae TaxID=2025720 RepID=A0A7W3Y5Y2_9GAMM|nr:septal ring lytic transglycosylase RlpA family protein [Lysobacter spongiae]MBB1060883.1 septal ring lytic transglycosylase RlpA family protein [Lysobacter spongiae]
MRHALAAAMILGLAACAGAPKKPEPAPGAKPDAATGHAPARSGRKVSPYAPAQEDPSTRGHYTAGGLYRPGVADSTPDYVPDVDAIPEPEVVAEPRSTVGNRPTYTVLGKQYHVLDDPDGYVEQGRASYYGQKFHGRRTSNLEVYDMYAFTAAHKTLPLPSFARVTNLDNGRSVVVRVNDRGPFHEGRVIDLSYAAAVKLDIVSKGTGRVEVRALTPGEDAAPVLAAAPPTVPAPPSAMDRLVASIPDTPAAAAVAGAPSATVAVASASAVEHRFDMRQDGRAMSAEEFDAWMKSRQVRVATGRPGRPLASPPATAVAPAPPNPATAAAVVAVQGTPAVQAGGVTLQVASFSARANADRALGVLRQAGIDQAQVLDAQANGKQVWRLRVGPLAETAAPELAARLVGLGFGQPQPVRD